MTELAARTLTSRVQTRENLRAPRNVPPRPVRVIQLSSSDLETIEATPRSERRLVQTPPLPRRANGPLRAIPSARCSKRSPHAPLRPIELSSSDLEPIETTPPSVRRSIRPPPLPLSDEAFPEGVARLAQSRNTAAPTRWFGRRVTAGLALLCTAITIAVLTFVHPTRYRSNTQVEPSLHAGQVMASLPAVEAPRSAPLAKSVTRFRQHNNQTSLAQPGRTQSGHLDPGARLKGGAITAQRHASKAD